jgi:hypothetical protein
VPLRFPNPGSDIARLVNSYRLIHRVAEAEERRVFDLDFMTRVMTENFQASSRGAIGAAAQKRSANADRSRDPLFNQSKMYSEVYRTLGWLRIGERRQDLSTTFLGDAVADLADFPDVVNGLVRQSMLALTFPNPATDNVGVVRHRPFRWLLLLTAELGGEITRDEMILGLLRVTDDRAPGALDEAVARIREVRGGDRSVLDSAVAKYAAAEALQVNRRFGFPRGHWGSISGSRSQLGLPA